jgi:hypothetical protein
MGEDALKYQLKHRQMNRILHDRRSEDLDSVEQTTEFTSHKNNKLEYVEPNGRRFPVACCGGSSKNTIYQSGVTIYHMM